MLCTFICLNFLLRISGWGIPIGRESYKGIVLYNKILGIQYNPTAKRILVVGAFEELSLQPIQAYHAQSQMSQTTINASQILIYTVPNLHLFFYISITRNFLFFPSFALNSSLYLFLVFISLFFFVVFGCNGYHPECHVTQSSHAYIYCIDVHVEWSLVVEIITLKPDVLWPKDLPLKSLWFFFFFFGLFWKSYLAYAWDFLLATARRPGYESRGSLISVRHAQNFQPHKYCLWHFFNHRKTNKIPQKKSKEEKYPVPKKERNQGFINSAKRE